MGTHDSLSRGVILGFWVVLVFGTSLCYGDDKNVLEVVGMGECADCAESNIETSHAFSGKYYSFCPEFFVHFYYSRTPQKIICIFKGIMFFFIFKMVLI